jgi:Na+/melibiose symporter-like transporter
MRLAITQKLSATEKFGYGLGGLGSNLVFQVAINRMMKFYTDVFDWQLV